MSRRTYVVDVIDIIRRLRQSRPIREIQREKGTHRSAIRSIRLLAERHGWLNPDRELPTEREVEEARGLIGEGPPVHPLDQYRDEIEVLLKDEASFTVIHQVLRKRYACDESTIRRYVQRRFPKAVTPVIRRDSIPGEVMEVDFGYLGLMEDDQGLCRKAWVFSGRLRYSRRAWREVVFDQRQETFFACHVHAFEHFGGVPRKVVPDNLKAAVIKASFEDPQVNKAYQQLAQHYGFLINPCLPYHPEHKGGVESDVKYVKGNFWIQFRHQMRQQGRTILPIAVAQAELDRWGAEVADQREIRPTRCSVAQLFAVEQPRLAALPPHRWEPVEWRTLVVPTDWHLRIDSVWYSVPHALIGEQVEVAVAPGRIQVFQQHRAMAIHDRCREPGRRITLEAHAPPAYHDYQQATPEHVLTQAQAIGPATVEVCQNLIDDPVVDGLRPARAVLSLAAKQPAGAVEQACRSLCDRGVNRPSYQNLVEQLAKTDRGPVLLDAFVFARRASDFTALIAVFITTHGVTAWILPPT